MLPKAISSATAAALLLIVLIAAGAGAALSVVLRPLTLIGNAVTPTARDVRAYDASQYCALGKLEPGHSTAYGTFTAEQLTNAATIYQVGASLGLPQYGATVAIATALQESDLINLTTATDHDSLGLFQQRPSQGWGTPAQVTDPVYASTAFYQHLVQVPGWTRLSLAQAAQAVQHSAYPDAYAKWADTATYLTASVSGALNACDAANPGNPDNPAQAASGAATLPAGYILPPGTPASVVIAIRYALAQLGKPYVWGGTGPEGYDCSGLVMQAYAAAGITLPRTTYQQVDAGTPVDTSAALKPGDLIFTAGSDGTPSNPGHVGIYVGDDLVEDAPEPGTPIELSRYDGGYWSTQAVAYRRVVKQD